MQDHRKLRVWQRSHALTVRIVHFTKRSPRDAMWIVGQLRRAAASIGANIAEGSAQESNGQYGRFIVIAIASAGEVMNHTAVARDVALLTSAQCDFIDAEIDAIRAILTVLLRRVRERDARVMNRT